ncbi:hypothetical protein SAMN06296386_10195 [Lachnospiraceae bacterium]|nr:hypothetical protein SAMN06296386_10195 [Lachnospiraceae bacterium]
MSLDKYLNHYLDWEKAGPFLAFSFAGLFVIIGIILSCAKIAGAGKRDPEEETDDIEENSRKKKKRVFTPAERWVERFYSLIFSNTSILFFISAYYLTDRFLQYIPEAWKVWQEYDDFILLAALLSSTLLNNLLDRVIVRLRSLKNEDRAAMKLVAMIYLILIFAYIKFIYEDNNYDELIMYFITLLIGRFVYFDASFHDFIVAMGAALKNIPFLLLVLMYSGAMCYIGFSSKFLLTSNGVIVSVLITHLFMDIAIFFIHHTRVVRLITRERKK